jgi:hypothetical protein
VVFKLCAAALWGAVRNLKGAANFFRKDEILQFFYRNLLGCAAKKIWSLLGCREPKSLKTTEISILFCRLLWSHSTWDSEVLPCNGLEKPTFMVKFERFKVGISTWKFRSSIRRPNSWILAHRSSESMDRPTLIDIKISQNFP